jgi:nitrogen fixation protein NifQ
MLSALDVYRWLMGSGSRPQCEAFDAHVVASVLGMAVAATQEGVPLLEGLGLSATELVELVESMFPHAKSLVTKLAEATLGPVPDDEVCLRDLLVRSATERTAFEKKLAMIVARRAQQPNHLWQDLGLRNRRELSWLMSRHFEPLANKNVHDMKWKKFLYRVICRDASFSLCSAPSCSECDDFDACFGDESGESLMASQRRDVERAARPVSP